MNKIQSYGEPYFFEKYFSASYHITFQPSVHRHPGAYNYSKEEMDRKSNITTDEFHVFLDVKEYRPDEITVKTINEMVIVEGKQQKRSSNEIPRHFVRHFELPEFFDSEDVFSTISDDGILEVQQKEKNMRNFTYRNSKAHKIYCIFFSGKGSTSITQENASFG